MTSPGLQPGGIQFSRGLQSAGKFQSPAGGAATLSKAPAALGGVGKPHVSTRGCLAAAPVKKGQAPPFIGGVMKPRTQVKRVGSRRKAISRSEEKFDTDRENNVYYFQNWVRETKQG
jgi:hypothetical protein